MHAYFSRFLLHSLWLLQFVRDVGRGIVPSWQGIVERHKGQAFSQQQRDWQVLRRGRCVLAAVSWWPNSNAQPFQGQQCNCGRL